MSAATLPTAIAAEEERGSENHLSLFSFLPLAEARKLLDNCRLVRVEAGELVLAEGSPGDFMAFVVSGRLAIKKPAAFPGRFILLAEIERGGMVGEGAVVCGEKHGATVIAVEKSELLALSRESLQRLLVEEQFLTLKLLTRIVQVISLRLCSAGERLSLLL